MNTIMNLGMEEITTMKIENERRRENGIEFLKINPHLDENDEHYQMFYAPVMWNGYLLDEHNNTWVDPILIDTHRCDPFPDNQGVVRFRTMGRIIMNALEPSPYTGGSFHVLTPSYSTTGWDYARTMTNMSWDKHEEDPAYINTRDDIDPDAIYEVEMHGGCGYVYIRRVDGRKEEVDAS
jgi:hypothetical protein